MMKKIFLFLFVVSLALGTKPALAQETMMDQISNVFLEKLIAVAKENYPRVKAMQGQTNIAKSALISQKSTWLDGLSFSYIYSPTNNLNIANPTFFNGYQAAIAFSVTELFQKSSNVRQAREGLKIAQLQQEEYTYTIEAAVKARYYAYIQRLSLLRLQTKSLADLTNINKDAGVKYAKGEINFEQYSQAQVALSTANAAKISAEADFLTAKATLEELLTKKIEEIQ